MYIDVRDSYINFMKFDRRPWLVVYGRIHGSYGVHRVGCEVGVF